MNSILPTLQLLVLSIAVTGCAGSPKRPPPPPAELVAARSGKAVVYFFRPELDATGANASPELMVNERGVARLPRVSYTYIELEPGEHTVSLRPTSDTEAKWAAQSKFAVEGGQVYFAAIWNQAQPAGSGTTVMMPVAGKGFFIPLFLGSGTRSGTVTFELVESDIGTDALSGLYKVEAHAYQLAPR
jgi:hypothetical protein